MSVISDLIDRIKDPDLRARISEEVSRLQKQKKFGLVFEEHLPEATPLYEAAISVGSLVSLKDKEFKEFFRVKQMKGETLFCEREDDSHERVELNKNDVVAVALFGQPIYPCLKPMDAVKNAPDSDLWHTLIEADNYHALQLLVYLYGGMVDCIYIDPPYNTGDKSWKYNNNYVDNSDSFRHSKWLSMMKKRLVLAKKLLNPKDSVLIVTIDEKEYLRLGCLLEEMFPEANIQMVSSVINPKGVATQREFSRVDEYIYYVFIGDASVVPGFNDMLHPPVVGKKVRWASLLRSGNNSARSARPNLYYPIFFKKADGSFHSVGCSLSILEDKNNVQIPNDCFVVWPTKKNGDDATWTLQQTTFTEKLNKGYIKFGPWKQGGTFRSISYLAKGTEKSVHDGEIEVLGKDKDGTIITGLSYKPVMPVTIWNQQFHSAGDYGSSLLLNIFREKRFDFPKSVYAEHDALRFVVANKPNALIVDFFAGSGTTLHAVNLLNAEDGGNRRCVMVTNNEVSAEEETKLKRAGYHPGQDEWEKWGIARYVNWPRTKCSILGVDVKGKPINGSYQTYLKQEKEKERTIKQITLIDDPSSLKTTQKKELVALCCQGKLPQSLVKADTKYIVSEDHPCSILFDNNYAEEWLEALEDQDQITEFYIVTRNNEVFKKLKADIQELLGNIIEEEPVLRPMSDGFAANAQFFKLSFLDKNEVALARQFHELLPLLWMKAGAIGECPKLDGEKIPEVLVLMDNKMAILNNEWNYDEFLGQMSGRKEIKTIFIVTDSEQAFRDMAAPFTWAQCYQLYRDYLDNFSINYEK